MRAVGVLRGRAAGGIVIFVRSILVRPSGCKVLALIPSLLSVRIELLSGFAFSIVCVYRSPLVESPAFVPDFLGTIECACQEAEAEGLPVFVAGDFNIKVGSRLGYLGQVEEFFDLLPDSAESEEVCPLGANLLTTISLLEYFRLPFLNCGSEQLTFIVRPTENEPNRTGGSIIDYVFLSEALVDSVCEVGQRVEPESQHVLLYWSIALEDELREGIVESSDQVVLTYDIERLLALAIPDSLYELANNPEEVTSLQAYDILLEFMGLYVKTTRRRIGGVEKPNCQSRELRGLRKTMRRVERLRKREQDPARGYLLNIEYQRLLQLWRERRELERKQTVDSLKARFWSAHFSGNPSLAWRIAKINLTGKGGGIRSTVTQAIPREDWESHFSSIYSNSNVTSIVQELTEVTLGDVRITKLDTPVTLEEVREALEQRKNNRAPGPDGLRIEFLRILRYEDVVCQAIGNFFSLLCNECVIPDSWTKAYLFVLYKGKGDRTSPNSFRGITLKSHLLKLFEVVLCNRLTRWLDEKNLLPVEQLAYRRNMSGLDHVYLLHVLRQSEIAKGGVLFAGFIDLRKAFPSVNRVLLIKELVKVGLSDKLVSMIRRLYVKDTFQLLLDGIPGTLVYVVVSGVHEGSCLAPILFIFFIRDLPETIRQTAGIDAPLIKNVIVATILYADDLTELSLSEQGLQQITDASVNYFHERDLEVNPEKSDFMKFIRLRAPISTVTCRIAGYDRESVPVVRYLGIMFDQKGKWSEQKSVVIARSNVALGRLKVIVQTIGRSNTKVLVDLFDSLVSSIYRFGLGAWGLEAGKMTALDSLFTSFITWLFRLPPTSCRDSILAAFGRRCALCDALFIASIQVANAKISRNTHWSNVVDELVAGRRKSKWFRKVVSGLRMRDLWEEVLKGGPFVGERKTYGVKFAQYCFHNHLNRLRGTSADDFRHFRPFGIYPFLYAAPPAETRFLLSFVLCNWRWLDKSMCRLCPRLCVTCGEDNTGWHILFNCVFFEDIRAGFQNICGIPFDFDSLLCSSKPVPKQAALAGRLIYNRVKFLHPCSDDIGVI